MADVPHLPAELWRVILPQALLEHLPLRRHVVAGLREQRLDPKTANHANSGKTDRVIRQKAMVQMSIAEEESYHAFKRRVLNVALVNSTFFDIVLEAERQWVMDTPTPMDILEFQAFCKDAKDPAGTVIIELFPLSDIGDPPALLKHQLDRLPYHSRTSHESWATVRLGHDQLPCLLCLQAKAILDKDEALEESVETTIHEGRTLTRANRILRLYELWAQAVANTPAGVTKILVVANWSKRYMSSMLSECNPDICPEICQRFHEDTDAGLKRLRESLAAAGKGYVEVEEAGYIIMRAGQVCMHRRTTEVSSGCSASKSNRKPAVAKDRWLTADDDRHILPEKNS